MPETGPRLSFNLSCLYFAFGQIMISTQTAPTHLRAFLDHKYLARLPPKPYRQQIVIGGFTFSGKTMAISGKPETSSRKTNTNWSLVLKAWLRNLKWRIYRLKSNDTFLGLLHSSAVIMRNKTTGITIQIVTFFFVHISLPHNYIHFHSQTPEGQKSINTWWWHLIF